MGGNVDEIKVWYPIVGMTYEVINDFEVDEWGVLHGSAYGGTTGRQIVPKVLYKTSKGYYYMAGSRRRYLDDEQEKRLQNFLKELSESDWRCE